MGFPGLGWAVAGMGREMLLQTESCPEALRFYHSDHKCYLLGREYSPHPLRWLSSFTTSLWNPSRFSWWLLRVPESAQLIKREALLIFSLLFFCSSWLNGLAIHVCRKTYFIFSVLTPLAPFLENGMNQPMLWDCGATQPQLHARFHATNSLYYFLKPITLVGIKDLSSTNPFFAVHLP